MNVLGIGPLELIFVLVVALLLLGPGKMVETARSLGKYVREFQRATSEVPRLLSLEEDQSTPPQRQQVSEQPPKEESEPPPQDTVARE